MSEQEDAKDPMRISQFADEEADRKRIEKADKAFKSREEYAGFRVPKAKDDEQRRYRQAIDAQRLVFKTEPIESLQKRYGDLDRYTARLFQAYHKAGGTAEKDYFANLIRQEIGERTLMDPQVSAGEAARMTTAMAEKLDDLNPLLRDRSKSAE